MQTPTFLLSKRHVLLPWCDPSNDTVTHITFNRRVPVVSPSAGDAVEQAGSGGLLRGQVREPKTWSQVGHRDFLDKGPLLKDFPTV